MGILPLTSQMVQLLSKDQISEIHQATLRILSEAGVVFEEEEACRLFAAAGAAVDDGKVRIPEGLLRRILEGCPRKFTLYAKEKAYDVELGAGRIHYTNGFGTTVTEDLESGVYRTATLADLQNYIRLADSLENVHYCLHQVYPGDIAHWQDVFQAAATITNTRKNTHLSVENEESVEPILKIAQAATEDLPAERRICYSSGATPMTPLRYDAGASRRLIKFARAGIPVFVVSGAMSGGSAPVTLAGTLAVQNAEILAGISLVQLISPGNPTVYGSFSGPMNMRSGKFMMGSPELALMNAATAQICRLYDIPYAYGTGGLSDSPVSDFQAGVEKSATLLTAALAGVEAIHDGCSGILDSGLISSYGQMVLDNESCQYVNRILRGISVSPDTIATELIFSVGSYGNYLAEEHTLKHFRQEHHLPLLFNRRHKPGGPQQELDNLGNSARQRASELIAGNKEAYVSPGQRRKIEEILHALK